MNSVPLSVLVIEDHTFQRSVAVNMLRTLGCRNVFEASGGLEALSVLERVGAVDIALCDLCMDGMDGLDFIKFASKSGLIGSVIISSSLPEDLRRAMKKIISPLGPQLLGDAGKPLQLSLLKGLLKRRSTELCENFSTYEHKAITTASKSEVRSALDKRQLQPWYQPKFNLRTGDVCGVEVLCRWEHPLEGVLPPSVFMPVIEGHDWLNELLFAQLDDALETQKQARMWGFTLNMAFNLHPIQLGTTELVSKIDEILTQRNVPGCALTFELVEDGLLEASTTSLEALVRLRMLGCRLSIDDFGIGFSSLQRLCRLPFNEIKLDREFVKSLDQEPRCRAVVSSTVALGEILGMSVVIEGIETNEQRELLIELGCIQGQGYFYARPMCRADFLHWLSVSHATKGKYKFESKN